MVGGCSKIINGLENTMTQWKSTPGKSERKRQHSSFDGPAHSASWEQMFEQIKDGTAPSGAKRFARFPELLMFLDTTLYEQSLLMSLILFMPHERNFGGDEFHCGRTELADKAKMSKRMVTSTLASLVDRGWLMQTVDYQHGNKTTYCLLWRDIINDAEFARQKRFASVKPRQKTPADVEWDEFDQPVTSPPFEDDTDAIVAANLAKAREALTRMNGN